MDDNNRKIGIFGAPETGRSEFIHSFSPYRNILITKEGSTAEGNVVNVFTDPTHSSEVVFILQRNKKLASCIELSDGIILFFNWADKNSLSLLPKLMEDITNVKGPEFPLAIVGTGYDPEKHEELSLEYAMRIPKFNLNLNRFSPIDKDGPFTNIMRQVTGSKSLTFCEASPTVGAIILRPSNPDKCILRPLVLIPGQGATVGRKDLHNGTSPTLPQQKALVQISKEHARIEYDGYGLVIRRLSKRATIAVENSDGKKMLLDAQGAGIRLTDPGKIHLIASSEVTSYVVTTLEQIDPDQVIPTSEMHLLLKEKHFRDQRETIIQNELTDAREDAEEAWKQVDEAEKARKELEDENRKLKKELEKARRKTEKASKAFKRAVPLEEIDENEDDSEESEEDCDCSDIYDAPTQGTSQAFAYLDCSDIYDAPTQEPSQAFAYL